MESTFEPGAADPQGPTELPAEAVVPQPIPPEVSETEPGAEAEAEAEAEESAPVGEAPPDDEPSEPSWRRYPFTDDIASGMSAAQEAVRSGQAIVLPTDTVYGVGADAFSSEAVQGLLDAKRRGRDMPPPVLIAEPGMLRALTRSVPDAAKALAEAFWPGALTLILTAQASLNLKLGETDGTVAVRVPDHEQTRQLLRRTGPLAVSSANVSGEPAATTCDDAIAQLGDTIAVYLDGGESPGGEASTIVDFTKNESGQVLRVGAISHAALVEVAPGVRDKQAPEPKLNIWEEQWGPRTSGGLPEPALEGADEAADDASDPEPEPVAPDRVESDPEASV